MKIETFIGVNHYTSDIIQLFCRLVFKHNAQKYNTGDLVGFRVIPVLKSEVSDGSMPS